MNEHEFMVDKRNVMIISRGIPSTEEPTNGLFEWDQAIALHDYGVNVAYVVIDLRSFRKKRKLGFSHKIENGIDIFTMAIPIGPIYKGLFIKIGSWAVSYIYRKVKEKWGMPDILHAHFLDYGYMSVKLSKKENIPLVLTDHSSDYNSYCAISNYAKKLYEQTAKVIAVSNDMKERIYRWTGTEAKVVHNLVKVSTGINVREKQYYQRFISAGNLVPEKNYLKLVNAFSKVENKNISLVIYGDGPEEKKIKDLISDLDMEQRIELRHKVPREQLLRMYEEMDAFILVSKQETFGVAYIEALACGLPVIATNCGGPRDFVNSQNGIIVDPNQEEQIIQAISNIASNKYKFDCRHISRETIENFSPMVIAQKLCEVYDENLQHLNKED